MPQQHSIPSSPSSETPPPYAFTFSIFSMGVDDWDSALGMIAEQVVLRETEDSRQPMTDLIEGLDGKIPSEIRLKVEALFHSALDNYLNLAAMAGYALAKTWPEGIHEFDQWPRRARAYLGLPEVEADDA